MALTNPKKLNMHLKAGMPDGYLVTAEDVKDETRDQNLQDSLDELFNAKDSGGGSGISEETDPIFTASPAHSITNENIASWNAKSDFSGSYEDLDDKPSIPSIEGLATETFVVTKIAEAALEGNDVDLSGYATKDDLKTKVDKVEGKILSSNDFTNEFKSKLENALTSYTESDPIFTTSPAYDITSEDIENWNSKSTFSGSYNDLTDKPTIPSISGLLSKTEATTLYQPKGSYLTAESDPIFKASPAYGITEENIEGWNAVENKVDKINGKGLSTEDFTTASKTKLDGIEAGANINVQANWNETDQTKDSFILNKPTIPVVPSTVSSFTNDAGYLTSSDVEGFATEAFVTTKIAEAALEGNDVDLSGYATKDDLNGKVDKVSGKGLSTEDFTTSLKTKLDEIENGAQVNTITGVKGNAETLYRTGNINITPANIGALEATAISSWALEKNKPSYTAAEVGALPSTTKIPTKVSDLTNDNGYLTTESEPSFNASAAASITNNDIENWNSKSEFSGSYNDLSDKPTIPSIEGLITETKADNKYQPKGSYITTESDPVFSASPAASITAEKIEAWNSKSNFSGSYEDLEDKPEIPSIEGLLSESDAEDLYQPKGNYLTEHQSLTNYALKSEIPDTSDFITEDDADSKYQPIGNYLTEHQSLSDYLKTTDAASIYQLKGNYALSSDIPSLSGYATESFVTSQGYLTEHQSLDGYATEDYVTSAINNAKLEGGESDIDLSTYATKSWVQQQSYLTEHQSLANYALKSEIPSIEGLASEEFVTSQGYLTEHQSLTNYALKSEIPSIEGLLSESNAAQTYQPKGSYLTTESDPIFTASPAYSIKASDITSWNAKSTFSGSYNDLTDTPTIPSIEGLISKTEADETYQPIGNYLTEHQSLENYAKKSEIPTSTSELTNDSGYLTEHQSLANYALKSEIPSLSGLLTETKAAQTYQPIGNYLTEHQSLTNYVTKSEITDFITEDDADSKYQPVGNYLTEHQSLTNYVTKSEITDFITEDDADSKYQPKGNYLTEHQSLTNYALKSEIPSLNGYATETYVDNAVSELINSAPTTLDTLNELAAALGNDANFSTTISTELGKKVNTTDLASVATSGSYEDLSDKPTIPSIEGLLSESDAEDLYQPKGNYLTSYTESDPVFTASAAYGIKASDITSWNAKSNFSGSYNDLTNKPTIPSIEGLLSESDAASTYQPKGSYLTTESDPVFSASPAYGITDENIENWNSKSEFSGSYNDLTNKPSIPSIEGLLSESDAEDLYQPKGSYLTSYTETDPIFTASAAYGIKASDITSWNAKSTFSGSYNDLSDKPSIPSIEGLLSESDAEDLYQPKGTYLTEHQSLTNYVTKSEITDFITEDDADSKYQPIGNYLTEHQSLANYALKSEIPSLSGYATETYVDSVANELIDLAEEYYQPKGNYLTEHQSLTNYVTKSEITDFITESDAASTYQPKGSYLTEHQSLANYVTFDDLPEVSEIPTASEVTTAKTEAVAAAQEYTQQAVADLVDSAPATMDTLKKLADAIGDNADIIETLNSSITEKADKSEIPTKVSDLTQDIAYLTEHQSLANYALKSEVPSITGLLSETEAAQTYQPKGSYLTTESDPVFTSSPAYGIKASDITSWNSKSTFSGSYNDLTNKPIIPSIEGLLSESDAEDLYQPKGSYLTEHQSLANYALKSEIPDTSDFITEDDADGKYQPKGSYLTEHQSLANYALKSEIPSLSNYATQSWVNNQGFLTSYTETEPSFNASVASGITSSDILNWNSKSEFSGSYNDLTNKPTIPSIEGLLSESDAASTYQPKGSYLTEHQSLANYALKSEIPDISNFLTSDDIDTFREMTQQEMEEILI